MPEQEIEVSGEKYLLIERIREPVSKGLAEMLLIPIRRIGPLLIPDLTPKTTRELVKEYVLIQQKESKLSEAKRDEIVLMFENNYMKL